MHILNPEVYHELSLRAFRCHVRAHRTRDLCITTYMEVKSISEKGHVMIESKGFSVSL
jgi:hypothetical protein